MVQRYEQTRKLQWYKRGAAYIVGHRDLPGTTPKECPCLDAHAVFGWIEELC